LDSTLTEGVRVNHTPAASATRAARNLRSKGSAGSKCHVSWQSIKRLLRHDDFLIFQDGGCRHLGFSKCRNFRFWKGQKGQNALWCQISQRSVKQLWRYGDFSIFEDGSRPPSWIFKIWKF